VLLSQVIVGDEEACWTKGEDVVRAIYLRMNHGPDVWSGWGIGLEIVMEDLDARGVDAVRSGIVLAGGRGNVVYGVDV